MPLLISSLILRERGAGQVDLSVFKNKEIILYEIKSSGTVTQTQYQRLKKAGHFISAIFGRSSLIRIVGPEYLGIAKSGKLH